MASPSFLPLMLGRLWGRAGPLKNLPALGFSVTLGAAKRRGDGRAACKTRAACLCLGWNVSVLIAPVPSLNPGQLGQSRAASAAHTQELQTKP